MEAWSGQLKKLDEWRWEIPKDYKPGMRVPGLIFANENPGGTSGQPPQHLVPGIEQDPFALAHLLHLLAPWEKGFHVNQQPRTAHCKLANLPDCPTFVNESRRVVAAK